jgi:uncharacterized protein YbaA (DUF1428 family)
VLAWIEGPNKPTKDAGMEQVTRDPRMQFQDQPPAFDGKRLIAVGFQPVVDEARQV